MSKLRSRAATKLVFPEGKRFAFTILDDTDDSTVENVRPVYDLLDELGFRTTKTAWPLDCPEGSPLYFAAETLQDSEYLEFTRSLLRKGFEFAFHGATMESSKRERTLRGIETVEKLLGVVPEVYCNHGQNRENLYWGAERYRTPAIRISLAMLYRMAGRPRYEGHDQRSDHFWGDIARARFRFVRNFAFATINPARFHPVGPYTLRDTPYVNYWFNTADAPDVSAFRRLVTRESIVRLEREGGVCILSTHLGKGFARDGRVDATVADTLRHLSTRPGWFVPVSTILKHLLEISPGADLTGPALWTLELRHILDRLRHRYA